MPVVIAILGLGEAGSAIGAGLAAAGATVHGWDVREDATAHGVIRAAGPQQAVRGSDVVLSMTTASGAGDAARAVAPALVAGQVFADLNSAGAPLKRELAEIIAPTGALFADVALMAPVPGAGVATPALASGPGGERFAQALAPFGMPVDVVGAQPGDAARYKLLRSVFMKGLAATVVESLAAGRAAGCERWLHDEIVGVLAGADATLVARLQSGSARHAERRIHEIADAATLLRTLGVEPRVCMAAQGWLQELRDG